MFFVTFELEKTVKSYIIMSKYLTDGENVLMKKGLRAFLIILCALAVLAALGGSESALSVWQAVGSIVALLHDGHTWVGIA